MYNFKLRDFLAMLCETFLPVLETMSW